MKKIFLIVCLASFISLAGCGESSPAPAQTAETATEAPEEEAAEEAIDDNIVSIDESDLYGTWKGDRGTPIRFNDDGTAESTAANLTGEYSIDGDELKIYWPLNDRTEIYKIKETNGKITLVYGEEPLMATYEKE